ncbi:MAG: hypothetical protein ABRQ23_00705 [Syntrophomonadaceae bacterium]
MGEHFLGDALVVPDAADLIVYGRSLLLQYGSKNYRLMENITSTGLDNICYILYDV